MPYKIFYSWQNDRPGRVNRNFLLQALERAVRDLQDDEEVTVEPIVDRDTAGVPGSPDIRETIFGKIDDAAVFVADITLVTDEGRRTPNPNVLLELGWAAKGLGWDRIILIVNDHYGPPEELPFDLAGRRVLTYTGDPAVTARYCQKLWIEA